MTLSTEITLQVDSKPDFSRRSLYREENGKWPCREFHSHLPYLQMFAMITEAW